MAVKLRFNIQAHCEELAVDAQDRRGVWRNVNAACGVGDFYQLGQDCDPAFQQLYASHKEEPLGRLQKSCGLMEERNWNDISHRH